MIQYVGILDGKAKSYGVRMPDLPGCYGAGATPEAALADALSAAREWIAQRETKSEVAPNHAAWRKFSRQKKLMRQKMKSP
jgi:predicted RNase H-like HicB family nuclease